MNIVTLIQKLILWNKNKVSPQPCDKSTQEKKRKKLEMQMESNTYRRYNCHKNAIYDYVLILLKSLINLANLGEK